MSDESPNVPVSDGWSVGVPRMQDEIYQAFKNEPTPVGIDPVDGLPRQTVPHSLKVALAPALAPETMVCMGDVSSFVLVNNFGDALATFEPHEVECAPNGRYRARTQLAYERCKASVTVRRALELAKSHGDDVTDEKSPFVFLAAILQTVVGTVITIDWVTVEPLRPPCKHYARQLTDFEDPDAKMIMRLCTVRRTDEGEFVSLRDTVVYACELRSPRDPITEQQLTSFDDNLVRLGRQRKQEESETFDVDAALNEQAQQVAAVAGLALAPPATNGESIGIFGSAPDGNVEVADDDDE